MLLIVVGCIVLLVICIFCIVINFFVNKRKGIVLVLVVMGLGKFRNVLSLIYLISLGE